MIKINYLISMEFFILVLDKNTVMFYKPLMINTEVKLSF